MTLVRQKAVRPQQQQPQRARNDARSTSSDHAKADGTRADAAAHLRPLRDPTTDKDGKNQGQRDQNRPSESMIDALAYKISNLDQKGIERAVKNLKANADRNAIPYDSPLATIGPGAHAATFYRGTLRRLLYSQPLPGSLGDTKPGTSIALPISNALKRKLAQHLRDRPASGFGYIVGKNDLLDQLIDEAYAEDEEQSEEERDEQRRRERREEAFFFAFLEANRHLGISDPGAIHTAAGQLMFFPELEELVMLEQQLAAGFPPVGFPALEAFMAIAGLPPEAASQFHWVQPNLPAADANLPTFGKRFSFSSDGYNAAAFDRSASDLPSEWVDQNLQPEMHNARINSDHQYNRRLLAAGRYNHVRC